MSKEDCDKKIVLAARALSQALTEAGGCGYTVYAHATDVTRLDSRSAEYVWHVTVRETAERLIA